MELKTNDGCFYLHCAISSSALIAAFQVNQSMFEYTICLQSTPYASRVHHMPPEYTICLQGSMLGVLHAYEEVALVKDIVIGISKNAGAEYSEVYKITEKLVNIAGAVISISRRCER